MIPTIHAAAAAFRSGELTPVQLLNACLDRIDSLEPRIRAWVIIDRAGAMSEAERYTGEMQKGQWRGPLHGIPIGIKDIFDVFDLPTAAGSRLWANSIARQDSVVVDKLRRSGAIILGKTVTTQYASFDPSPTKNPWIASRTPGGSSSGSAAAVACGMCPGAVGSQTGGSITRPASFCGVVSMKPSYGRVSLQGAVPLAHSMDHPGPMARCVRDLALLIESMASPFHRAARKASILPVLGRVRGMFESRAEPAMNAAMDKACQRLHETGFRIVEVVLPASFEEVTQRHHTVMAVEAAQFHEPRLRGHPEDYDPCIRSLLEIGLACPAPAYARCKNHQSLLKQEMKDCFVGIDCLLTPATIGPAPAAETTGNPLFNSPWSYTGLPTVSFPITRTAEGLPLAIQLVGSHGSDSALLHTAFLCEQAIGFEMPEIAA